MTYVYILINRRTQRLYIGFTTNLKQRVVRIRNATLIGSWLTTRHTPLKPMPASGSVI